MLYKVEMGMKWIIAGSVTGFRTLSQDVIHMSPGAAPHSMRSRSGSHLTVSNVRQPTVSIHNRHPATEHAPHSSISLHLEHDP
jgi:hypothetical protein